MSIINSHNWIRCVCVWPFYSVEYIYGTHILGLSCFKLKTFTKVSLANLFFFFLIVYLSQSRLPFAIVSSTYITELPFAMKTNPFANIVHLSQCNNLWLSFYTFNLYFAVNTGDPSEWPMGHGRNVVAVYYCSPLFEFPCFLSLFLPLKSARVPHQHTFIRVVSCHLFRIDYIVFDIRV